MNTPDTPVKAEPRAATVVTVPTVEAFAKQYAGFSSAVVTSMKEVATLADQRLSTFFLSVGTVALFMALVLKLQVFGAGISDLQPVEFVALLAFAALLYAGGLVLRLQQYSTQDRINAELRSLGMQMAEESRQIAIDVSRRTEARADRAVQTGIEATQR